ncbi:ENTH-domain-containing protein, partial [Anaeromyces robustus]
MSHVGKKILRTTKNYTKGYSEIQIKTRKATSNENKCPNNLLLNDIALASYNEIQFLEIMEILEKRLNDKGKNWRHIYKSLTLLEYLLYNGSEMIIKYTQNNIHVIKTLKDFQYIDENNHDEGINVRVKSKEVYDIIMNEGKLLSERSRLKTNGKIRLAKSNPKVLGDYDEEYELQKAIEVSKETLIQDEKRRELKRSQENLIEAEKNKDKGKQPEKSKEKDLLILDEPIPDEIQPKDNMQYQQIQYQRMQQQFQDLDLFNNNNGNMLMNQNQNNMMLGGNMMNNNNMMMGNNNNMLMGNSNIGNSMMMGSSNNVNGLLMGNNNLGNSMMMGSSNNVNGLLMGNNNNNNMLMGNNNNNN